MKKVVLIARTVYLTPHDTATLSLLALGTGRIC